MLSIDDIIADGKSLVTGDAPQTGAAVQDEGVATGANADTVAPVNETSETETRTPRRRTSSDEGESTTEV